MVVLCICAFLYDLNFFLIWSYTSIFIGRIMGLLIVFMLFHV